MHEASWTRSRATSGIPVRSVEWFAAILIVVGCFTANTGDDAGADAGDAAKDTSCVFCNDAGTSIDPFGDAALGLRTRSLFGSTCSSGPESGCHFEHAANFTATLDPDGGDVINVLSTEMPPMVRVAPFDAGGSYLFWKVTGDPRIDGGQMPLNETFDPRIPALIGEWIDAGAP